MQLPITRLDDTVDDYHGTQVADPYRWLENADSAETQSWVDAQQAFARAHLDQIPALESIKTRYTELYNYPKFSAPHKHGGHYFFSKNTGLRIKRSSMYRPL